MRRELSVNESGVEIAIRGRSEDGVFIIEDFEAKHDADIGGLLDRLYARLTPDIYKVFIFIPARNIETIKILLRHAFRIEGVHPGHFKGLNYLSLGRILKRREEDPRGPEFNMDEVIHFYGGGERPV